ncbi:hypothetical protein DSECCO2_284040 [anaerobic digester metagenome]
MGYTIPAHYDSMISKLCALGSDREEAIQRMRRAIYEYVILGVKTTLPLHYAIMHNAHFIAGDTHTHFLQEEHIATSLRRYLHEEEARMQTLAASLRQGKHVAAITAAVDVYIRKNTK